MPGVWIALWLVGVGLLIGSGLAYAATLPLLRRRPPDPPDTPPDHGLACEAVGFASRDGLALGGWWIPAEGAAHGTIVLCPGQNGSLDKDMPQALPLHHAGFNVLMFDFRGHGRSEGEMVTLGALEQADLFGALDYLAQARGIERVGVLGFSMGAGVTLLVAAQDARIAALVVDGAYPRLSGLLTGYLRQRGLPEPLARVFGRAVLLAAALRVRYELYRANPVEWVDRITAPTLFIHGERDPFMTTAQVETLAGRVQAPTEIWRVAEAGHREAFRLHPDDYNRRVVAWFERYLAV